MNTTAQIKSSRSEEAAARKARWQALVAEVRPIVDHHRTGDFLMAPLLLPRYRKPPPRPTCPVCGAAVGACRVEPRTPSEA